MRRQSGEKAYGHCYSRWVSLEERSLALLAAAVEAMGGDGEHRAGQEQMTAAVAQAFEGGRHLAVAAGTGTGKSLAYLIPAVLSGRRVVVATVTKALQDQLATKELPFLAAQPAVRQLRPGDRPFRWAVLKGRSNYICRQLIDEASRQGVQLTLGDAAPQTGAAPDLGSKPVGRDGANPGGTQRPAATARPGTRAAQYGTPGLGGTGGAAGGRNPRTRRELEQLIASIERPDSTPGRPPGGSSEVERLIAWADRSGTGDRAEVGWALSPGAWERLSVSATQCPGRNRCPQGEACFAEAARTRAERSDIVVVNTHLLVLHLLGVPVLPAHDLVIIDEAHRFEDTVTAIAGITMGERKLRNAGQEVNGVIPRAGGPLTNAGRRIADVLEALRGERLPADGLPELQEALTLTQSRLETAGAELRALQKTTADTDAEAQRLRALGTVAALSGDIAALLERPDGTVAFVEGGAGAPELRLAPLEVGGLLAEALFGERTVVMTSATLGTATPTVLGLTHDDYRYIDVGSPFDYPRAGLLYCAGHLPPRNSPDFTGAAIEELEALISAARGRTLALFTSHRMLKEAADALRGRLRWPLLCQGDLPPRQLLERFATEDATCLFATIGFWQGVDVPGPALTLVTLDRLPFPRPDDPLLSARREHVGEDSFRLIDLRRAAILLAQGAGRLIRTGADRGVVAVLDPRLATARYRSEILEAMPPLRRTVDRAEVLEFLSGL